MKTLEDTNASPETIKSIKQFLLQTSIPRLVKEREEENDD